MRCKVCYIETHNSNDLCSVCYPYITQKTDLCVTCLLPSKEKQTSPSLIYCAKCNPTKVSTKPSYDVDAMNRQLYYLCLHGVR